MEVSVLLVHTVKKEVHLRLLVLLGHSLLILEILTFRLVLIVLLVAIVHPMDSQIQVDHALEVYTAPLEKLHKLACLAPLGTSAPLVLDYLHHVLLEAINRPSHKVAVLSVQLAITVMLLKPF